MVVALSDVVVLVVEVLVVDDELEELEEVEVVVDVLPPGAFTTTVPLIHEWYTHVYV